MLKLFVTTRDGAQIAIDAKAGLSVMELIRGSGSEEILALCGGSCSCATCHVYVDASQADKLPPMSDMERDLLSCSEHVRPSSRLSCQILFEDALDGLKVTIAPDEE